MLEVLAKEAAAEEAAAKEAAVAVSADAAFAAGTAGTDPGALIRLNSLGMAGADQGELTGTVTMEA